MTILEMSVVNEMSEVNEVDEEQPRGVDEQMRRLDDTNYILPETRATPTEWPVNDNRTKERSFTCIRVCTNNDHHLNLNSNAIHSIHYMTIPGT